jgi:hypothetical protein
MNISVARVDLEPAGGFDCCCADDPSVGCLHTSIAGAIVGQIGEAASSSGDAAIRAFVERWRPSEGGERRTYQMFLTELCGILGVGSPETVGETYVFERNVSMPNWDGTTSLGRIDLYKRGCFVLEAKQGSFKPAPERPEHPTLPGLPLLPTRRASGKEHGVRGSKQWDDAMLRARAQAKRYIDSLPDADGVPPFMVIVDVGFSFELWSDFSGTGRHYTQFPDTRSFRFNIETLADAKIRDRLRKVWESPHDLDPSRISAKVTRDIADKLARLAKSLEKEHAPKAVADFLMRCLFTMFAEDVGILRERSFTDVLLRYKDRPPVLRQMLTALWRDMNHGTAFSTVIEDAIPQFNGALYANAEALLLTAEQIDLMILAAKADWREVEPAIFGTLLERALDESERHRLGAHYTPRAYVERLVLPTIIEPLRTEWEDVKVAALTKAYAGDFTAATDAVKEFHRRLCAVTILDPACGSGNFLYVSLEHLKRLEGEVLDLLVSELGETQDALELAGHTVDPHQFLGIEKNERAVPIAEMVLWIGHLQWYARSRPKLSAWPKPVLKQYGNIRAGDALLTWRSVEMMRDESGKPLTRWDGISKKLDPITGEEVPDETARVPMEKYVGPKAADWPVSDFIIGNPPFIGGKDLRQELGDGYTEALWSVYEKAVPNSADFVMYWWHKAAERVRVGKSRRFGFITTNSLPQTFSRRVVETHMAGKNPISLLFAIPDHPCVKALNENEQEAVRDAAQVRVAMTAGVRGAADGRLLTVVSEQRSRDDAADVVLRERRGAINADLTIGSNVTQAHELAANRGLSSRGVSLHGAGFIVTPDEAKALGLGRIPGLEKHILLYRHGRDLTGKPRGAMVIDLFGLTEHEVRQRYPEVYQWVLERVRPHRKAQEGNSADADQYAEAWWLFGKTRPEIRRALAGLSRYIATVETAKHRVFQFLDEVVRPDNKLIVFAFCGAHFLGVLSSRIHIVWALAAGGRLGVGNDPVYVKSACFDKFPFPDATAEQQARIRALAEELDALRKRQQAAHPDLTLTGMYNVLVKLQTGQPLDDDDREVNEKALVSTLRHLHDQIDAAVADAYGWPAMMTDEDILARVVALNKERQQEEVWGKVRWLRPEFQVGGTAAPAQPTLDVDVDQGAAELLIRKTPWPKTLPEQVQAVRAALVRLGSQRSVDAIARQFKGAKRDRVAEILQVMAAVG